MSNYPVSPSDAVSSGPSAQKKGCSSGCKTFAVGLCGVMFGIALTIGVKLWAVAAGVQAVQSMFSGPADRQNEYSSSTTNSADRRDEEEKRERNQRVVEKCVQECTKAAVTGGE